MKKVLVIMFFLFLAFSIKTQAKIAPIPFEELVKDSDSIIVGKVESVERISNLNIAKVKVINQLKGNFDENIYFLAESTWSCDISYAEVGETALFFFSKFGDLSKFKVNGIERANFKKSFEEKTGKSEFFAISSFGYGRMPLQSVKNKDYLKIFYGQVIFPDNIKSFHKTLPDYSSFDLANYKEIIDYTNECIQKQKVEATENHSAQQYKIQVVGIAEAVIDQNFWI